MNPANALTLSRLFIALAVFAMLLAFPPGGLLFIPFLLLVLAGITDILDGHVARRLNCVTEFGRVADAFIDRILAIGCFVVFLQWQLVQIWMVLVILIRELVTGGMRNLADARGLRFSANVFGKTKFASQYAACLAVVLYRALMEPVGWMRVAMNVIIYIAVINTFVSGVIYLANYKRLVGHE